MHKFQTMIELKEILNEINKTTVQQYCTVHMTFCSTIVKRVTVFHLRHV